MWWKFQPTLEMVSFNNLATFFHQIRFGHLQFIKLLLSSTANIAFQFLAFLFSIIDTVSFLPHHSIVVLVLLDFITRITSTIIHYLTTANRISHKMLFHYLVLLLPQCVIVHWVFELCNIWYRFIKE